jgi:uncharacterized protein (DUF2267 family)
MNLTNRHKGDFMANRGLDVFENTFQKTYEWLNDLMDLLGWNNKQKAYLALRGTLHALRDRLPVPLAAKLGAQLPMLVRGFYYEGWRPTVTPIKIKSADDFLDYVAEHFTYNMLDQEPDVEHIVRCVFQLLADHLSPGEIHHIVQALPDSIAELWCEEEGLAPEEMESRIPNRRYSRI